MLLGAGCAVYHRVAFMPEMVLWAQRVRHNRLCGPLLCLQPGFWHKKAVLLEGGGVGRWREGAVASPSCLVLTTHCSSVTARSRYTGSLREHRSIMLQQAAGTALRAQPHMCAYAGLLPVGSVLALWLGPALPPCSAVCCRAPCRAVLFPRTHISCVLAARAKLDGGDAHPVASGLHRTATCANGVGALQGAA